MPSQRRLMNDKHKSPPIGEPLPDWDGRPRPVSKRLAGRWSTLEPLDSARHADALYRSLSGPPELWTYLSYGPFANQKQFADWLHEYEIKKDRLTYVIGSIELSMPVGMASYLRIDPDNGSIEIGGVVFSSRLKQTTAATEAIYLLLRNVFELGYRRCEWKCDSLNAASRAAAIRFGFVFEGIFRQSVVYKNRNRDTAWFSITDREWKILVDEYERWLSQGNFDMDGHQLTRLRTPRNPGD